MKKLSVSAAISILFAATTCWADTTYPSAQTYASGIPFRGVSLAGGDFADDGSGNAAKGNFIPTINDAALFLYRGMNIYRVPVVWEYLADINGHFKTDPNAQNYLQNLDALINSLVAQNATIILDLHNYMRYNPTNISLDYQNTNANGSDVIGLGANAPSQAAYANLWANLEARYPESNMIYGIMNEPHDIGMAQLLANENAAIAAIRSAEKASGVQNHWILIDGNNWTGLHSWTGLGLGSGQQANSNFFPSGIQDSANHFAIEVHQYLDSDGSGTYASGDCLPLSQFKNGYSYQGQSMPGFDQYWQQFSTWMQTNKVPVFLGEFGSPDTANCRADIQYMLNEMNKTPYSAQQGYGIMGWIVWAAGSSWGNYINSIAPGGPANTLMWDNELYQNYLTETQALPALGPQIIQFTNNTQNTYLFSSGNWPFQVKGSATLAPGQSLYLYSPNASTNSPKGKFALTYHQGTDNANVIGVGLADGWGFGFGSINGVQPVASSHCSITGDNGDTKRCWILSTSSKKK